MIEEGSRLSKEVSISATASEPDKRTKSLYLEVGVDDYSTCMLS